MVQGVAEQDLTNASIVFNNRTIINVQHSSFIHSVLPTNRGHTCLFIFSLHFCRQKCQKRWGHETIIANVPYVIDGQSRAPRPRLPFFSAVHSISFVPLMQSEPKRKTALTFLKVMHRYKAQGGPGGSRPWK